MSIVDVAKAAGVSTATVSRVMNALPGVRNETIALVRAAIAELNYQPRRAATMTTTTPAAPRAPRRRRRRAGAPVLPPSLARDVGLRTGTLCVVTVGHGAAWLERPVLASAISGIQRGCGELGLRLMLDEMRDPDRAATAIAQRQVDGAIVFVSSELDAAAVGAAFAAIRACGVPAVWAMGTSVADDVVDHVTIDNVAVGHLAAGHLRAHGCRRLAFLATDPAWPLVRLRGQSFLNRAHDDACEGATAYLVADAGDRTRAGYGNDVVAEPTLDDLVRRIAADAKRHADADRRAGARSPPLGLFVYNDFTLSHVHPLLARHGLRVGRNVSVVSCDHERARLEAMHPRPASIDIGAEEIGFRSVVRLLARIQRPDDRLLTIHVAPRL